MQSPLVFASIAAGTARTLGDAYSAVAPAFLVGAYVVRADWLATRVDIVRRFVETYTRARVYVNGHLAETASLVADVSKLELPVVQKMRRSVNPTTLEPGQLQPIIDAAYKYRGISRSFPARELIATL